MTRYDVFNGDADGLCALVQLRLADPVDAVLVTGVKRDIDLLRRVPSGPASITVLDISLESNRQDLERLLSAGAKVRYFDHHYAGEIPRHPGLDPHIETLPDKGTSLLVDAYLGGRHRAWAVVGTFGDNFDAAARRAAEPLGLIEDDLAKLRELGVYINYNGYGATVEDLHLPPDDLYRRLVPYRDPLAFIAEDSAFPALRDSYAEDMAKAQSITPEIDASGHRLFVLPAERWARRVSGTIANDLARAEPDKAHAILTRLAAGGFVVSVRAPLRRPEGADALCRQFPTGGGRKAAAGINELPEASYAAFVACLERAF